MLILIFDAYYDFDIIIDDVSFRRWCLISMPDNDVRARVRWSAWYYLLILACFFLRFWRWLFWRASRSPFDFDVDPDISCLIWFYAWCLTISLFTFWRAMFLIPRCYHIIFRSFFTISPPFDAAFHYCLFIIIIPSFHLSILRLSLFLSLPDSDIPGEVPSCGALREI